VQIHLAQRVVLAQDGISKKGCEKIRPGKGRPNKVFPSFSEKEKGQKETDQKGFFHGRWGTFWGERPPSCNSVLYS